MQSFITAKHIISRRNTHVHILRDTPILLPFALSLEQGSLLIWIWQAGLSVEQECAARRTHTWYPWAKIWRCRLLGRPPFSPMQMLHPQFTLFIFAHSTARLALTTICPHNMRTYSKIMAMQCKVCLLNPNCLTCIITKYSSNFGLSPCSVLLRVFSLWVCDALCFDMMYHDLPSSDVATAWYITSSNSNTCFSPSTIFFCVTLSTQHVRNPF